MVFDSVVHPHMFVFLDSFPRPARMVAPHLRTENMAANCASPAGTCKRRRWRGLFNDSDPALKLMIDGPSLRRLHRAIDRRGIFALFGAPIAHEDHPQRALYSVLRMQEDVKRYAPRSCARKRESICKSASA
jgi:hypothetical protein